MLSLPSPMHDGAGSGGERRPRLPALPGRPRDNNVTIYEPGRAGDGLAVMHRGEITRTARECQVEPATRSPSNTASPAASCSGPRPGRHDHAAAQRVRHRCQARAHRRRRDDGRRHRRLDKPIGYFSAVRTVTFDGARRRARRRIRGLRRLRAQRARRRLGHPAHRRQKLHCTAMDRERIDFAPLVLITRPMPVETCGRDRHLFSVE